MLLIVLLERRWSGIKINLGIFSLGKRICSQGLNGIQRSLALRPSDFLVNLENELIRELDLVLRQGRSYGL